MDIMELGAIGELVGGVAVVASLLYVALQIRHANRIAEDDASRVLTDLMSEIQGRIASDREHAEWFKERGLIAYVAPRQSMHAAWSSIRQAYLEDFRVFFDGCLSGTATRTAEA